MTEQHRNVVLRPLCCARTHTRNTRSRSRDDSKHFFFNCARLIAILYAFWVVFLSENIHS